MHDKDEPDVVPDLLDKTSLSFHTKTYQDRFFNLSTNRNWNNGMTHQNYRDLTEDEIKDLMQQKTFSRAIVEFQRKNAKKSEILVEIINETLLEHSNRLKDSTQEKIVIGEILVKKSNHKKYRIYLCLSIITISITSIGLGYSYYEDQLSHTTAYALEDYPSSYLIQNLQDDSVNSWVAWNIPNGKTIHIHFVNDAKLPQDLLKSAEDAILSTDNVTIDASITGNGPKGSSSVYYTGWQGALAASYLHPTMRYIPQKFDISYSPYAMGDVEILFTKDISPDGYSGFTKSITDGNEILKSKITIFHADSDSPDRLAAVVRHEFGHAMGLGHSSSSEDLMYSILPDYPLISKCDVNVITKLYNGSQNSKIIC